jgi:GntR family transcriptional regulator of arabinose operon
MKDKPIYQIIHDELLDDIHTGRYKAGEKILSEKELAEKYHVSRITSKQAMEMLATENVIVRRPGLGSFVTEEGGRAEIKSEAAGVSRIQCTGTEEKMIGVIFDSFDFAFGCELLRGIEWECSKEKLHMNFCCTYGDIETEKRNIEQAVKMGAAGLIIMCVHNEVFDEQILRCVLDDFPLILVDRNMAKVAVPCVTTDNYAAACELTEMLYEKGHEKICFVSHINHDTSTIRDRLSGFKDACLKHGQIVNDEMIFMDLKTCTPTELEGIDNQYAAEDEEKMTEFIQGHPDVTAYFASQYKIGLIIIHAIRKLGMEDRIDVVFFDGPSGITFEKPYYARAIQDEKVIGQTAVKLLHEKMDGKKVEESVYIPYHIMV